MKLKTKKNYSIHNKLIGYILEYTLETAKEMFEFSEKSLIHTEYQTDFEMFLDENNVPVSQVIVPKPTVEGNLVVASIHLYELHNGELREQYKQILKEYFKTK